MWQCGTAPCCLPLLPPPAPTALAAAAAVVRARPRAAKVLRATHHQGACHRRCAGDASRLREAGSPRQGTTRASQLIVGCTCPSGLGGRIQSRRRAAALEMGQKKGPFRKNGPKERAISSRWAGSASIWTGPHGKYALMLRASADRRLEVGRQVGGDR